MNYIIRELKSSESKKYREIRLEALREYPEYFGSNYNEQCKLEKLYFERIIEENFSNGLMVGAFLDTDLIAICGVSFNTHLIPKAGELIQMYVQKKYQGNNISKELITFIFENVKKQKGIESIVLDVNKNNVFAIRTYINCGFVLNSDVHNYEETQFMFFSLQ